MGCVASSNEPDTIYKINPKVNVYKKSFTKLGLDHRQVEKLYALFTKCAIDKTVRVSTSDMLFHLHEKAKTFMGRIITVFAQDKKLLNFQEFVYAVWSFCTLRSRQKAYGAY